jgi:hypothetical protein
MNKETLTVYTGKDGTITYYTSGKLHNPHGPAIVWPDGHKEHWINGKRHNPHGPAVVLADGSKQYYINDKRLTKADFKAWQAKQAAK